MRFYKENLSKGLDAPHARWVTTNKRQHWRPPEAEEANVYFFENRPSLSLSRIPVKVPTGIASFPNELVHSPRLWAEQKYHNIVTFTYMARGGHFAAMEEPQLMAEDIQKFTKEVEKEKK